MALKDELPKTAAWVSERRAQWGNVHVTDMLKRAMAGEPGCCYTVERVEAGHYRTFGAPFALDWSAPEAGVFGQVLMGGGVFAGVMRPPKKIEGGANGQS